MTTLHIVLGIMFIFYGPFMHRMGRLEGERATIAAYKRAIKRGVLKRG
jgi:hypothetical protein